jgi:hypothetical protein
MTSYHRQYEGGWVRLDSSVSLITAFWLDGFPPGKTEEEKNMLGIGAEKRVSPIFQYNDGGIGFTQWVNFTHDTAALLRADGGWQGGGTFHLWVSPGAGKPAYEIPFSPAAKVVAGDPDGWLTQKEAAIEMAEEVLGLVLLEATPV